MGNMASDSIELAHLNRPSDVVDISERDLLSMLQECTQQSLLDNSRSFEMNLAALESRLYERYIVGRKLISFAKTDLCFEFAGQHDIQSFVDRINYRYAQQHNMEYFEEGSEFKRLTD